MTISCLGLVLFGFLGANTPLPSIIGTLLLLGIGLSLFVSPNTNAVMSSITPRIYGVASATINTMRQIGQMLSMGIVMIVLSSVMGRVTISQPYYADFITSTRIAFIIFALLSLGGIFASFSRGKMHQPAEST